VLSRGLTGPLKERCFWALGDWLRQRTRRGHAGAVLTDGDSFLNAFTKHTKWQKEWNTPEERLVRED